MNPRSAIQTIARPEWLPAAEYPFALRAIDVAGDTVAYVDEGEGPTLLFVHTGMWSFVFRDVITRLRSDFRCVALDFPGFGLSPEPAAGAPGLARQGELLAQFVTALHLDDVTLVLHDLGGPVGMAAAAAQPNRIRGFVLANTFAWRPDQPGLRRMLRITASRPVTWLDTATGIIPRLTTTSFGIGRHASRAGKRAFLGPLRDRRRVVRFHALLGDALAAGDLYDGIEAATAGTLRTRPVLTIFGEKNDPFGFQERHHATFPDHQGVVVAGGHHFPMMDDPDLFAESVRVWSRRRPAG